MNFSGAADATASAGFSPVDQVMATAREKTVDFFTAQVPPGCEEAVLAQAVRVQREMARTQYAMLARLARALFQQQLPQVEQAFETGLLSLGEAAAVAKCVNKATEERDQKMHPDAAEFRAKMETGLFTYKAERPQISVSQITSAAKAIAAHLDPDKADRDYDEAFEERGAQLYITFEGNFLLRMWGPAADGELLKAAIKTYTQPYGPENADQPKHERTYDAVMLAMEAAAAWHGHAGPGPTTAPVPKQKPGPEVMGNRPHQSPPEPGDHIPAPPQPPTGPGPYLLTPTPPAAPTPLACLEEPPWPHTTPPPPPTWRLPASAIPPAGVTFTLPGDSRWGCGHHHRSRWPAGTRPTPVRNLVRALPLTWGHTRGRAYRTEPGGGPGIRPATAGGGSGEARRGLGPDHTSPVSQQPPTRRRSEAGQGGAPSPQGEALRWRLP